MGGELSIRPGEDGGLWKVGVGIGTIAGRGPGQTDDGWDPGKCGRAGLGCSCLAGSASQPGPGDPGTFWGVLSQVRGLHPMGSTNNSLSRSQADPEQPRLLLRCSSPARIWGGPSRSPGFVLLYSCDLCNEVRMEELAQGSIPGKGREAGMATAASLRGWNGEGEDETLIAGGSGAVPPRPCRGR